jgi:GNAT superfamily N-acetyltransferase
MTSAGPGLDAFTEGFRERVIASRQPGQEVLDEPGFVALVGRSAELLDGRALVTDDRSVDLLRARLPGLHARVVNVFAAATESHRLLGTEGRCRAEPATAMVREDLDSVPELGLPDGLTLRTVASRPAAGEVSLVDAAACAVRSDPGAAPTVDLDGFVAYLAAIPRARFLAATDDDGQVRATAAAAVFGRTTGVFFVDTEAPWRGQGVGAAMTAAALRAAAADGAQLACLDSSALGLSIYRRLGFREVTATTLFVHDD